MFCADARVVGVADQVIDAFVALAAQNREAKRRRAAKAIQIPYHPVLAGVFLGMAVLFLLAAGYFGVATVLMLTDDLVMFLGYILAPIALMAVLMSVQFMVWAIGYSRRSS